MEITTLEQLYAIYPTWQEDFESMEFARWADINQPDDLDGEIEVVKTVAILDQYYADTRLKH